MFSWKDRQYARAWKKSALNHEYFVPLGFRAQLSVLHLRRGSATVGTAINRQRDTFGAEERAVYNLVAPQISQAWRTALMLAALPEAGGPVAIAIDPNRRTMRALSPRGSAVLRKNFAADGDGAGRLPDELERWLREQMRRTADATLTPLPPLVTRRNGRRLTARLARFTRDETLVLIDDEPDGPADHNHFTAGMTKRESEILNWIAEGKQNREVGIILDVSARTIGKHLEHIFAKLGVETRGAAVRAARMMGAQQE